MLKPCTLLLILVVGSALAAGIENIKSSRRGHKFLSVHPHHRAQRRNQTETKAKLEVRKPKSHHVPVAKSPKVNLTKLIGKQRAWSDGDGGPHSFDYLLGENDFSDSSYDVVFVDYEVVEEVISQYLDEGKTVICYVNVGAWEEWRSDADDFPEEVLGEDYEGWPGERWLDIRDHDALLPIMRARYELAASKGCEGIDPDNMNGYTIDSGFDLSYDDQLDYNFAISDEAHDLGMLAGIKNDNEQAADLIDAVDFAVLEQCAAYDECYYFEDYVSSGKPVFAVEYTDEYDEDSFTDDVCPLVDETGMSFILKDYDLHADFIVSCL